MQAIQSSRDVFYHLEEFFSAKLCAAFIHFNFFVTSFAVVGRVGNRQHAHQPKYTQHELTFNTYVRKN